MMKKYAVLSILLVGATFQANAGSLYDIATACTWTFGRTDGLVISTVLKLSSTGRVTGYSHPNEYSWAIEDGNLLFRHQDGRISTIFTSAVVDTYNGQIILKGAHLFSSSIIHTLVCEWENLIVNGSFEEGNWIDANGHQRLSPDDTALSGWTIGGSGVDWHVGTPNPLQNPLLINPHLEPAQAGSLVVDLNLDGGSTGTISQTFATRAGTTYSVSFYMAGVDFFTNPRAVDVEVDGVSRTFSQTASPQRQLVWGRKFFAFTATGSQATLTFRSPDLTGFWGPLLDSVSVVAAAMTDDPATTLITHYYASILERAPESGGLAYWQGLVAEKQDRGEDVKDVFRQMADFFFNSPEYIGRNTTDRQFITNLYLTFFQRTPDEGGYAFWLDQLARGMLRNQAMSGFLYSQEFTDFMELVLNEAV